jgi:putative NADH-flavin reductase
MKVCVVGASGKLGRYMVQHALDRGHEVVGVCREESVGKLDAFKGRMTIVPGATDDTEVIKRAVAGCDGVLVVLVPRGVHGYSTGTAQAVLDHALQERASCSPVAGTSPSTAKTSTRGSSGRS